MRRHRIALLLLASCLAACGPTETQTPSRATAPLQLFSSAFEDGGPIPVRYTCDGEDTSPPLAWSGVPDGVQSFALIVTDPDAGGFVHWVRDGIQPAARELAEGDGAPNLRPGQNDFGRTGWSGPCPPSGEHRYVFTLYALSAPLEHGSGIALSADSIRALMEGRIVATGELTGTYERR